MSSLTRAEFRVWALEQLEIPVFFNHSPTYSDARPFADEYTVWADLEHIPNYLLFKFEDLPSNVILQWDRDVPDPTTNSATALALKERIRLICNGSVLERLHDRLGFVDLFSMSDEVLALFVVKGVYWAVTGERVELKEENSDEQKTS